ncbi:MAG: PQQ-binding-like beta-propeller repeat protein [Verrucomicrobiota bacterium]
MPERGTGPTATPIAEHGRIYTVGANGFVHCLDVKTGKVIWGKNLWKDYTVEEMGCRPSPLIEGSLLIVFMGAKPGATVLALNKKTGKEVWKALDEHASNSSPLIPAQLSPSGYRESSRSHLIDPTWPFDGKNFVYAPPAFANRHVIARSEGEVVCASLENRRRTVLNP